MAYYSLEDVNEWMNECEWMNEWMNEWMDVNEWIYYPMQ